jgi:hypothetical protein
MLSDDDPDHVKDMDVYQPHGCNLVLVDEVHIKQICSFEDMAFWFVDGAWLRKWVDIDFTQGGNPGRYSYVPEGEIWVDNSVSPEDVIPTMIHELVECRHMRAGEGYDEAHERASRVEIIVRQQIPDKTTSQQENCFST